MRFLSFIIIFLSISVLVHAQSPHGSDFELDCSTCHQEDNWKVDLLKVKFDHNETGFKLSGQHKSVNCRSCHESLVFKDAKKNTTCFSCHKDVHQNSVGFDCAKCHSPESWSVKNINEIHQMSRFPLLGMHLNADCISCHKQFSSLNFTPTGIACYECHAKDFKNALNPNHVAAGFSTECKDCHSITASNWSAGTFAHDFFPLVGGHKISNCFSCHAQGGDFKGLSTDCYSCHKKDFEATTSPNHVKEKFSIDCKSCHNITAFIPSTFNHNNTNFPLTGKHVTVSCGSCHTSGYAAIATDCYSCHKKDYDATTDPNHLNGKFPFDCTQCHTTSGWATSSFDHNKTNFPLTGAHQSTDCQNCHQNGYVGTSTECVSCHQTNYNNTTNPNHKSLSLSTDCKTCHTTEPGWKPAAFPVHNQFYELIGAHASIANDCSNCHNGNYTTTPNQCVGCHQTNYDNTTNPPHKSSGFSTDCVSCHNQAAWKPATFDHDNQYFPIYSGAHKGKWNVCSDCHTNQSNFAVFSCITCHEHNQTDTDKQHNGISGYVYESGACFSCHPRGNSDGAFNHATSNFPLTGAHQSVDCASCHKSGYAGTSMDCVSCHQANYNSTTNPNHKTLSLSTDCKSCHTTDGGWKPAKYPQHSTVFALTGGHASVANDCESCHKGNYSTTSNQCVNCHQTNYNNTTNPNHKSLSLSTDCKTCHTTEPGWKPAAFPVHNQFYELIGAHASIANDCSNCHNGNYTTTPNQCVGCHQTNYDNTTNPPHKSSGFSTDCVSCHNQAAWKPATFDHDNQYFPIYSGAHKGKWNVCSDCHTNQSNFTVFSCITCHEHNQTDTDKQHNGISGYVYESGACFSCHPRGNSDGAFNHATSNFPLTGAHQSVDCASCHKSGYAGTSMDCVSCHQANYNSTTNPNHKTLSLSTDCKSCHTTDGGWKPAKYPQHSTVFALTGGHASVANECESCHKGNYSTTSNQCVNCHQTNYNNTTNPNHKSLSLSTDCKTCHTTEPGWKPAAFPVHNQFYELIGAHASIANDCSNCHNGNYTTTPKQCVGCHQTDFDNTTNPAHKAGGFSTDCTSCHTQTSWKPATFDHDNQYFPVYSGSHRGKWNTCADCHTNQNDYKIFSCITCHEHNQSSMDSKHNRINGYSYESSSCFNCHPNGRSDGAFNHATTGFPLTGDHQNVDCSKCHQNGYAGTPTTCVSCHQSKYNSTTNPNHKTLSLSTDCKSCHTTDAGWKPAKYPQHSTVFALTGGHASVANDCESCHKGNYSTTSNQCASCHQIDFNNTTNPNHKTLSLSTDCKSCHTTASGWKPAKYPQHSTVFALTGGHASVANDCESCHKGNYSTTSNQCASCHQTDYNSTTNPNHKTLSLSTDCKSCHTTASSWKPAKYPQHSTVFALTGGHASVANDCESCHNGNYSTTSNQCASCHQSDYNSTTNPNHKTLSLSTDCKSCHTTASGWKPAKYPQHSTVFALTGGHASVANDCESCHNGNYKTLSNQCISCHQTDYNNAANPNHKTLSISTDCKTCHTTDAGWKPAKYPQHSTVFPLTGGHASVASDCEGCHKGNYKTLPNQCVSCHQSNYNNTTNPNHKGLALSTDCKSCHTTQAGWKPATFPVHNTFYQLIGAHASIANNCADCHTGNYSNTPNQCVGCHQKDYDNTTNPAHKAGGFSTDCLSCHSQSAWKPATFDHDNQNFPIYSGSHNGKWNTCNDCHSSQSNYKLFTCITCHEHSKTTADGQHKSVNGYTYESSACFSCHPRGQSEGAFNHATSNFPLTGAHQSVDCASCHQNGYAGTPTTCVSCHQSKYNSTTNPNHKTLSISTDCKTCHTTDAGWKPAKYPQHSTVFALTGGHAAIANDCAKCHSGNYTTTPNQCVGCHQTNYNNTTNPNHKSISISTDCKSCHTTDAGWKPAKYPQHSTVFALTGGHASIANDCAKCHNGNYNTTSNKCVSCHQQAYNDSKNPSHTAIGMSTDCAKCHNSTAWIPSTFSHAGTGFSLTGKHATVQCSSCHKGTTSGLDGKCITCHQSDFNSAPQHVSQNYPATCEMCHNTTAWDQSTFDHAKTNFPLTGAHINTNCSSCHSSGFTGTSTQCYACHKTNYENTNNPNHKTLALSTDCKTCHTTQAGWKPASFPNHDSFFQLIGAHANIKNNCATCHNGNYTTTPNQCIGCHQTDFNNTTNPNHKSNGFSTDCESCHSQTAWKPSTFDHDNQYFPIYSGSHRGKWNLCSDCHTNQNDFNVFSCITCHEHNKTSMDSKHRGRNGYVYESSACYNCHPRGRGDMPLRERRQMRIE